MTDRSLALDRHNHSSYSYDASNRFANYKHCFECGYFDILAITDHNTMKAGKAFRNDEFRVIIGEEIDTQDGELIGLFLDDAGEISKHRSVFDTAREIQERGGIVYLQHPFYRWLRKSHRIHPETISGLLHHGLIDVIETANAGPFMAKSNQRAAALARHWDIPQGAGSDAHHPSDIGRSVVRIPWSKDPFELDRADLLAGLHLGQIDSSRVRASAATLGVRFGYSVKVSYARLTGGERKRRETG